MIASRLLVAPLSLAAIALLVINDHVLKTYAPGVVTGKLSDVAGMIFFPLLLAAALEQVGLRRGAQTIVAAALATGIVFAAVKLWTPAGDAYRAGLAALQWPFRALAAVLGGDALPALGRVHLTADPTDLLALPALLVPITASRGRSRASWRPSGHARTASAALP